jgi:hypothetical protein
MHGHVLSVLDRARDSYKGEEWEQLPEARQDRILSAPFHDARVATRSYKEEDWGRAVVSRMSRKGKKGKEGKEGEEQKREGGTCWSFLPVRLANSDADAMLHL